MAGRGAGAEEGLGGGRKQEASRSFTPLSALPGISPSRGEIGSFSAGAPLATLAISERRRDI
ncbi:hypothetical protein EOD04_29245 [Mesorhizobium sp. M2C.T.Ca.TU.009.01.2.1]|nr:hypothetical protein EOD04_29245 [Mesorhizobium sp. M2C.T.Ca.TU.009.01.2.1]